MDKISAYHMTDLSNIKSIVQDGLVPDIGRNSKMVHEVNFLVYFTTNPYIDKTIKMLQLNPNSAVILNFECDDYANRGDYLDCCTKKHIKPEEIKVIVNEQPLTLGDFYNSNKEKIDLYHDKKIADCISKINERLKEIKDKKVEEEDVWDYEQIDPDIISTMYLLKLLRNHDRKSDYKEVIKSIKSRTFSKLKENKVNFTENTEIYNVLDYLFEDSMEDNHKISILDFNYLSAILIINLYYRQCIRYNETGKKPDDNNDIWNIDIINLADLPKNNMLSKIIEETKSIHEQMSTNYKKI